MPHTSLSGMSGMELQLNMLWRNSLAMTGTVWDQSGELVSFGELDRPASRRLGVSEAD